MASTLRWTSADLDALPDDGKRYEIIDGELLVSKQPHLYHQDADAIESSILPGFSARVADLFEGLPEP